MTEHALREGMRTAVTAEPPLGFSTDKLIATARRRARRRRTMMASAATAAVVVAGSVGAVSLAGQQEPGPARLQAACVARSRRPASRWRSCCRATCRAPR
jgi:hypothetical protein